MEEKPRRHGHGQLREEEPPLLAIDHHTGRRTPATTPPFAVAGKPKKAPFFSFLRIESRSGVRKAEIPVKRAEIERDLSVLPLSTAAGNRCGKRHGGGRQHGRVGVVLVADNMGEWEEASGSLGFWDWAWMLG
ncbi:uncharacterized protein [Gossypium hirsutum]|uniref:Uncharacterized protein isoform X1 n=1 Tax=Gossypium hirsutum TaxID=3635 RepID=A0ABM3B5Y1_GOSHI|nr:uncharacterized protein LOC121223829 isoform X1 [Gossypium hirsutum]